MTFEPVPSSHRGPLAPCLRRQAVAVRPILSRPGVRPLLLRLQRVGRVLRVQHLCALAVVPLPGRTRPQSQLQHHYLIGVTQATHRECQRPRHRVYRRHQGVR